MKDRVSCSTKNSTKKNVPQRKVITFELFGSTLEQYLFSFIKFLGLKIIEAAYTRCSWFHTPIKKLSRRPMHKNIHPIFQIKDFKYTS